MSSLEVPAALRPTKETIKAPLVSVVMPVFNAGRDVLGAVAQLQTLTHPNLEFIMIDDGSSDDTVEWLARFADGDKRARLIALEENVGAAEARNIGLRAASGTYVWFVDWDDEWVPDIVSRLTHEAETHGADLVFCRGRWKGDFREGTATDGPPDNFIGDGVEAFTLVLRGELKGYLWTKLFRTERLPDPMFPLLTTQEDICGLMPVVAASRMVVGIPDSLYTHVVRNGSLTNSRDPNLDNLTAARDTAWAVASTLPGGVARLRAPLLLFDYEQWLVPRVLIAMRRSSPAVAKATMRKVRKQMRWAEIFQLARVSAKASAKAATLKAGGRLYLRVRALRAGTSSRTRHR